MEATELNKKDLEYCVTIANATAQPLEDVVRSLSSIINMSGPRVIVRHQMTPLQFVVVLLVGVVIGVLTMVAVS
jgi:hypothetical protein